VAFERGEVAGVSGVTTGSSAIDEAIRALARDEAMTLIRQVVNRLWEQVADQDAPVTRLELVSALLEADAYLEQEMDEQT